MSTQALLPGIFDRKTNCTIHYTHVVAGILSLVLILIVTISTLAYVNQINKIMADMNELVPDARLGIDMLKSVCRNVNFTHNYPNAKEVCAKF